MSGPTCMVALLVITLLVTVMLVNKTLPQFITNPVNISVPPGAAVLVHCAKHLTHRFTVGQRLVTETVVEFVPHEFLPVTVRLFVMKQLVKLAGTVMEM